MDPATVIALCKENIQPLRHGRNATQLGTALRAQEDVEAQQLLMQEKQMYEDAIKNYEGDDPLENWYEYILWVEQSYPKNGHESHIGKLLQQCLTTFEKETKYYQDRRYIRLWINYISMQKNPLEVYQMLYNAGIGTMVADMYRAWAFELEQVDDYKKADEVYMLGITARAEPRDELIYARENFQLAVGRKTLGCPDDRSEIALSEQRQAFSSLRAIKAGKRVTNMRTGHRVKDYFPGVISQSVPQIQGQFKDSKSNTKIQIYEDEAAQIELRGASILDHIAIEDTHKENTLKPGQWSNASKKHHQLIPTSVRPAFKIHEDGIDDNFDFERLRLFPNHTPFFDGSKYPEHMAVPVFVPDAPSAVITKPRYPKDLVYANNIDKSMEEIRAERYLNEIRNCENNVRIDGTQLSLGINQCLATGHDPKNQSHEVMQSRLEKRKLEEEELRKQCELEEQRRKEEESRELERQRNEQLALERKRLEAELERQRQATELKRQHEAELERQRIEAERIEAERIESQRMEAELSRQSKLQSSNYMQHSSNSGIESGVEQLLGQSLTVNTKEAMSVIQDLWNSPSSTNSPLMSSPMVHRMDSRSKLNFDIHIDSSMTQQHAISDSRHHINFNIQQSYHDQENHQHFNTPYNTLQEHHQSFQNHGIPDPYHYQVQQQVQPPLQHTPQLQAHTPQLQTHHPHQSPHIQTHMEQSHNMMHHQSHLHQQHPQMHQSYHQPHIPQSPLPSTHSQPPHLSHHSQSLHNASHLHPSPHAQLQHHHVSPHIQHHQQQHHIYNNNMHSNNVGYHQQYPMMPPLQPEPQKQLHFAAPYVDHQAENKAYRKSELPFIKSPGMNRRDLKFLESTDNKENAAALGFNTVIEEKQVVGNNLYVDESLGISPLPGVNDTCLTEGFREPLLSSTPMTNQFRPTYRTKEILYQQSQAQFPPPPPPLPQEQQPVPNGESDDKLSTILESTREYTSSSGSSANTRTTQFGFTIIREDEPLKDQSISQDLKNDINDTKMQTKHQAIHAQSPRTMQRNVDLITSEIKNNCDLRIPFNLDVEPLKENNNISIECQYSEPMEETEEEEFKLPSGDINPFDKEIISGLLRKLKFPRPHHSDGYTRINKNLNKFVPSSVISLGTDTYELDKCLGKGTYGTVMKAFDPQTRQTVALKTQKPAWVWEFYIAREIKARLTNPHMLRGFMDVSKVYVANNGSVLVSEYSKYGTLLAVTNQVKIATGKPLSEPLAIFFTIEMLQIVEYLHKCQIIHGDIKPDNFLLMHLPTEDVRPTIQLIDFGCSIDMTLFPEGTKFTQRITTEDFTCIEMQTGRPWTYQTDLYCVAASAHCLLFGIYMRAVMSGNRWFINSKMPRYVQKDTWETLFTKLLNIESCEVMPDLVELRKMMEEALAKIPSVEMKLRALSNVLNNR
ncbi:uncharacterized protein BubR1 [Chelonus insularis]|uniref:uncharacterized protein BubR1 n=1 Tax=Chelonus insularis TaxID=460826 RepID=UPI00158A6B21|nr:uncharacterized protein LOC118066989 [Chelonus insularis]XP_034939384.1 uncharacterized protein LOC118066989 [Chelonus insularis]